MSRGKIHAEVIGEGKPVLFLPSGDFTGVQGRQLARRVIGSYEWHLLDLPGIGLSDGMDMSFSIKELAQWLNEYIEARDLDKVIIIAHSLGGLAAIAFSSYYPRKTDKLILLDTGHKSFGCFPIAEFGMLGVLLPGISWAHKIFPVYVNRSLARLFLNQGDTTDLMKQFCERQRLPANQYIKQMFENLPVISPSAINLYMLYFRTNLPKLMQKMKVNTLLLWANFAGLDEKEAAKSQQGAESVKNKYIITQQISGGHYVQFHESALQYIFDFLNGENK